MAASTGAPWSELRTTGSDEEGGAQIIEPTSRIRVKRVYIQPRTGIGTVVAKPKGHSGKYCSVFQPTSDLVYADYHPFWSCAHAKKRAFQEETMSSNDVLTWLNWRFVRQLLEPGGVAHLAAHPLYSALTRATPTELMIEHKS